MTVAKEHVRSRGTELAGKIKNVLHEGNVRRIIVKDSHGRAVMEVPVTVGAVAFVAAPFLTVAATLAAVASEWTVRVERQVQDAPVVEDSVDVTAVRNDEKQNDESKTPAA
ncbi:DUF4342 domain-containing protein [Nonomuraea sp. PA05]|uniref:DUF4342 domain-containing protein n=1 Tax=Nonomuraea sp. PA05 TaxID=2604466 RepID=UPI00165295DF|nr:DUF4342 domain-containing protein [Nonomuraea sp. PA05]